MAIPPLIKDKRVSFSCYMSKDSRVCQQTVDKKYYIATVKKFCNGPKKVSFSQKGLNTNLKLILERLDREDNNILVLITDGSFCHDNAVKEKLQELKDIQVRVIVIPAGIINHEKEKVFKNVEFSPLSNLYLPDIFSEEVADPVVFVSITKHGKNNWEISQEKIKLDVKVSMAGNDILRAGSRIVLGQNKNYHQYTLCISEDICFNSQKIFTISVEKNYKSYSEISPIPVNVIMHNEKDDKGKKYSCKADNIIQPSWFSSGVSSWKLRDLPIGNVALVGYAGEGKSTVCNFLTSCCQVNLNCIAHSSNSQAHATQNVSKYKIVDVNIQLFDTVGYNENIYSKEVIHHLMKGTLDLSGWNYKNRTLITCEGQSNEIHSIILVLSYLTVSEVDNLEEKFQDILEVANELEIPIHFVVTFCNQSLELPRNSFLESQTNVYCVDLVETEKIHVDAVFLHLLSRIQQSVSEFHARKLNRKQNLKKKKKTRIRGLNM